MRDSNSGASYSEGFEPPGRPSQLSCLHLAVMAADVVAQIVRDCGLDPVYAGPLKDSWKFERARPVYCRPLDAEALREGLAATTPQDFVPENSWKD